MPGKLKNCWVFLVKIISVSEDNPLYDLLFVDLRKQTNDNDIIGEHRPPMDLIISWGDSKIRAKLIFL